MEDEEDILLAILGRGRTLVYLDIGPLNDEERAMFEARLAAVQTEQADLPADAPRRSFAARRSAAQQRNTCDNIAHSPRAFCPTLEPRPPGP